MQLTPDYIKQLALNLRFRLSDEEANDILKEFETLLSQLALLEAINTDDIEPMVYPNESETHYLRLDTVEETLDPERALANAPHAKNGYFVSPKVVD